MKNAISVSPLPPNKGRIKKSNTNNKHTTIRCIMFKYLRKRKYLTFCLLLKMHDAAKLTATMISGINNIISQ